MRRLLLILPLLATPALAQDEAAKAQAVLLPMTQELVPGRGGEILAACIYQAATPEERATIAAAPGPSEAIAQIVNGMAARPELAACIQSNTQ